MKAHSPCRRRRLWPLCSFCAPASAVRLPRRVLAVLLAACALVAPLPGAAGAQTDEDWETLSVRELMQQDLRRAMDETARTAAGPGAGAAGPGAGASPRGSAAVRPLLAPRLVALYGVGRALMAEVQVGRDSYLYVRGQSHPAGYAGDRTVYQLRGMNGACVQLERGEDRHSLCLRMLLGEVQP